MSTASKPKPFFEKLKRSYRKSVVYSSWLTSTAIYYLFMAAITYPRFYELVVEQNPDIEISKYYLQEILLPIFPIVSFVSVFFRRKFFLWKKEKTQIKSKPFILFSLAGETEELIATIVTNHLHWILWFLLFMYSPKLT